MRSTVLADTPVLVPAPLRDTLLRLAAARFYDLRWSAEILTELRRVLASGRRPLTDSQIDYLFAEMRTAFPEADVLQYDDELQQVTNHPKDRHVLAAAVAGEADIIITFNVRHFRPEACSPFGITVEVPDDLFSRCLKEDPELVNQLLIEQVVDLRNPRMSQAEVLSRLHRYVPRFVETLVTDFGAPEVRQELLAILPRRATGTSR
jgi:predicted nucleic acid-binding protein